MKLLETISLFRVNFILALTEILEMTPIPRSQISLVKMLSDSNLEGLVFMCSTKSKAKTKKGNFALAHDQFFTTDGSVAFNFQYCHCLLN